MADAKQGERVPYVPGLDKACASVVYPHVFNGANREVGGVLVGQVLKEGHPPLVKGAIEALHADEQRATLTFTQDAWEHVHRTIDRHFPDDQIVGWYHSHPGFGIFLSDHDLFIHREFFSGPSQIALVVDPVARTEGLFHWKQGEIVPLPEQPTPSRWLARRPAERRRPSAATPAAPGRRDRGGYPPLALGLATLVGVAIGFGAWTSTHGGANAAAAPVRTAPAAARPAEGAPKRAGDPRRPAKRTCRSVGANASICQSSSGGQDK